MTTRDIAGLAYIEHEIATNERRIKKIKDNPDPSKPQSNILLYELERDFRIEQREAYRAGRPLGKVGLGPMTRALHMVPWDGIMAADRTHGKEATRYFEMIRKDGMPENTCDRCSVLIPMMLNGDFPKPDFVLTTNFECIPVYMALHGVAQILEIPSFHLDRPFQNYMGVCDDESLRYVTKQLEECIEYVEAKIPGAKFDEDYLVELQHYDRQYLQLFQQLWKLKAAIPCPLSGRESFREVRLTSMYKDPAKAVKYMQLYVEEVAERVEKGVGAAQPEEKLRLLWSVAGPFYSDPFSWLEKRGVSIPAAEMTIYNGWFSGRDPIWGDPWKGRKLTPLEEEARQFDFTWGRLGDQWIKTHMNSCRDLHMDGIIYFLQTGCPASNNLGKVVADTAEKELGIPTLLIEGRMLESSGFDEKAFYTKMEEFIEICQARKESRI
jgi:(R)-2-hydroxyisocaproyl-CoA dehydratase alpha subunit